MAPSAEHLRCSIASLQADTMTIPRGLNYDVLSLCAVRTDADSR